MSMHKRGRGSPKLPRGEVDLEALQDAFLRNREKPSAKLIRSKVRICVFKCHEEVFSLQPIIPPKRCDIFSPDWMLRRSRRVQIFL